MLRIGSRICGGVCSNCLSSDSTRARRRSFGRACCRHKMANVPQRTEARRQRPLIWMAGRTASPAPYCLGVAAGEKD
jgi:hypothetical protein